MATDFTTPERQLSFTLRECRIHDQTSLLLSGNITLIVRDRARQHKLPVFMKLFDNCPKHYAELYRKDDHKFRYGFFDYCNCSVKKVPGNECQFDISRAEKGVGLRFETTCSEEAEKWIGCFRCNEDCPYSPANRRKQPCNTFVN